jgi:hypothetical protein
MYEYKIHTLIDITENGRLNLAFPFKTLAGEVVHDKHTLAIARNQNNNFTTMIQLLQLRGNVTWESPPIKLSESLANMRFGTAYNDTQTSWHFKFFTEQAEVYGDTNTNNIGNLIDDFDLIPILSFCKETVTFPTNTFITANDDTINTYFSYAGEINK